MIKHRRSQRTRIFGMLVHLQRLAEGATLTKGRRGAAAEFNSGHERKGIQQCSLWNRKEFMGQFAPHWDNFTCLLHPAKHGPQKSNRTPKQHQTRTEC
eukprot:1161220-Pelagomonas_calceolata.AAC.11